MTMTQRLCTPTRRRGARSELALAVLLACATAVPAQTAPGAAGSADSPAEQRARNAAPNPARAPD